LNPERSQRVKALLAEALERDESGKQVAAKFLRGGEAASSVLRRFQAERPHPGQPGARAHCRADRRAPERGSLALLHARVPAVAGRSATGAPSAKTPAVIIVADGLEYSQCRQERAMAEPKTKQTKASVARFIAAVDK
jgi:hypothetical protein